MWSGSKCNISAISLSSRSVYYQTTHLVFYSDEDLKPSCVKLEPKVDLWRALVPRGASWGNWTRSLGLLWAGPSLVAPVLSGPTELVALVSFFKFIFPDKWEGTSCSLIMLLQMG